MFDLSRSQIIDELNRVRDGKCLHGLKLNDQLIFDNKIGLKYADFDSLVKDWENRMDFENNLQ